MHFNLVDIDDIWPNSLKKLSPTPTNARVCRSVLVTRKAVSFFLFSSSSSTCLSLNKVSSSHPSTASVCLLCLSVRKFSSSPSPSREETSWSSIRSLHLESKQDQERFCCCVTVHSGCSTPLLWPFLVNKDGNLWASLSSSWSCSATDLKNLFV